MPRYGIVGAGGFGREVLPVAVQALGVGVTKSGSIDRNSEVVFIDERLHGTLVNGYRVESPEDFLSSDEELFFNVAVADASTRRKLADFYSSRGAHPFEIRAPNSVVLQGNEIGAGAILCPFTTVTSNAIIGQFFHANIYSYVAHDCRIGDFVTFAPAVHCNGGVVIEDHAYIGTGAVIRQGTPDRPITIGKGAVVGMGAVVTKSVPAGVTVVGNPAAPLEPRK